MGNMWSASRRRASSRVRALAVALVEVLVLTTVATVAAPAAAGSAAPGLAPGDGAVISSSGATVEPLVPHRILDTRDGTGAPARPVGPGSTIVLQVAGRGGVPALGAGSVVINVTATEATANTYITVFPTGVPHPLAANLNVAAGATVPNLVVAKLGVGGTVSLFNYAGSTHLVADVQGWFPEGSDIRPMTPTRLLDTRDGTGAPVGGVSGGESLRLQVSGRGGIPATGVGAVIMNVAVTEPTAASFLTVYPSGVERPLAANLNFVAGQTIPNLVIAKVGADGAVDIFNYAGSTHVVADVAGWFPASSGFEGVTPARLLDTRDGTGGQAGPVAGGTSIDLQVTGRGGVPGEGVGAVVLNVAVTDPTASSFITVYPTGVDRPLAANLNMRAGQTVPNLVIAKVGADGRVSLFNYAGSTHLVVDVAGWFRAAAPGDGTTLTLRGGTVLAGAGDVVAATGDPTTGGTVTLAASADAPPVGGHLAVTPQPSAPAGFFGFVRAATPNGDGTTTFTIAPAPLDHGFLDIVSDHHRDVPAGVIAVDEPVEPGFAGGSRPGGSLPPARAAAVEGIRGGASCETSSGLSVSPSLSLGAGQLTWRFRLRERHVLFQLPLQATLGFSASLSGSFSCTLELLPVMIPLGPLGTLDLTPQLTLSATAQISASATLTADMQFGFEVRDGRTTNLSFFLPQRSGDVSAEASVTLSARPSLKADVKLFGIAGAFVDVGVTITAVYSIAELPCLWISAQHGIDFGFEVGRWGVAWSVTLASITGPQVRFYERSDICPATSFMPWIGSISVSGNRAEATKRIRDANGTVVATLTSRKSYSYSIVSSRSTLVNTNARSEQPPPGVTVSFPSLVDSSEYRDASPASSCNDLVAVRAAAPWSFVTALTRDPATGEQIVDPRDGETVYLLVDPGLATEVRCSGGEVISPMAPTALYAIGSVYDGEFDCMAPAVAAAGRGACYLPLTVSGGGTRLRFEGQLRGTWDEYGFPVPITQTVRVDLTRTSTLPG